MLPPAGHPNGPTDTRAVHADFDGEDGPDGPDERVPRTVLSLGRIVQGLPAAARSDAMEILESRRPSALAEFRELVAAQDLTRARSRVLMTSASKLVASMPRAEQLKKAAQDLLDSTGPRPGEAEVPWWLGEPMWGTQLHKGAGHKYLRRVPTGKARPKFRYYYSVTGGAGLGHHDEFKVGAKFKLTHGGKEGHFHVAGKAEDGRLRIVHDETGHEALVEPEALAEMLHREHAGAVDAHKDRVRARLKRVRATGSDRQVAAVERNARRYGHTKHLAEPKKKKKKGKKKPKDEVLYAPDGKTRVTGPAGYWATQWWIASNSRGDFDRAHAALAAFGVTSARGPGFAAAPSARSASTEAFRSMASSLHGWSPEKPWRGPKRPNNRFGTSLAGSWPSVDETLSNLTPEERGEVLGLWEKFAKDAAAQKVDAPATAPGPGSAATDSVMAALRTALAKDDAVDVSQAPDGSIHASYQVVGRHDELSASAERSLIRGELARLSGALRGIEKHVESSSVELGDKNHIELRLVLKPEPAKKPAPKAKPRTGRVSTPHTEAYERASAEAPGFGSFAAADRRRERQAADRRRERERPEREARQAKREAAKGASEAPWRDAGASDDDVRVLHRHGETLLAALGAGGLTAADAAEVVAAPYGSQIRRLADRFKAKADYVAEMRRVRAKKPAEKPEPPDELAARRKARKPEPEKRGAPVPGEMVSLSDMARGLTRDRGKAAAALSPGERFVYNSPYGQTRGEVARVNTSPDGRAISVDVTMDDGRKTNFPVGFFQEEHTTHGSRIYPEAAHPGGALSPAEVAEVKGQAVKRKADAEAKAAAEKAAHDKATEGWHTPKDRNEANKRLRAALKTLPALKGHKVSVTGSTGTGYGYIHISGGSEAAEKALRAVAKEHELGHIGVVSPDSRHHVLRRLEQAAGLFKPGPGHPEGSLAARHKAEADERTRAAEAGKGQQRRVGDVVTIHGGRRRYVITGVEAHGGAAHTIEGPVFTAHAMSGGTSGSHGSSLKDGDMKLHPDQALTFDGKDAAQRRGVAIGALKTYGRSDYRFHTRARVDKHVDAAIAAIETGGQAHPKPAKEPAKKPGAGGFDPPGTSGEPPTTGATPAALALAAAVSSAKGESPLAQRTAIYRLVTAGGLPGLDPMLRAALLAVPMLGTGHGAPGMNAAYNEAGAVEYLSLARKAASGAASGAPSAIIQWAKENRDETIRTLRGEPKAKAESGGIEFHAGEGGPRITEGKTKKLGRPTYTVEHKGRVTAAQFGAMKADAKGAKGWRGREGWTFRSREDATAFSARWSGRAHVGQPPGEGAPAAKAAPASTEGLLAKFRATKQRFSDLTARRRGASDAQRATISREWDAATAESGAIRRELWALGVRNPDATALQQETDELSPGARKKAIAQTKREIDSLTKKAEGLHGLVHTRAQATTREARLGHVAQQVDSLKDKLERLTKPAPGGFSGEVSDEAIRRGKNQGPETRVEAVKSGGSPGEYKVHNRDASGNVTVSTHTNPSEAIAAATSHHVRRQSAERADKTTEIARAAADRLHPAVPPTPGGHKPEPGETLEGMWGRHDREMAELATAGHKTYSRAVQEAKTRHTVEKFRAGHVGDKEWLNDPGKVRERISKLSMKQAYGAHPDKAWQAPALHEVMRIHGAAKRADEKRDAHTAPAAHRVDALIAHLAKTGTWRDEAPAVGEVIQTLAPGGYRDLEVVTASHPKTVRSKGAGYDEAWGTSGRKGTQTEWTSAGMPESEARAAVMRSLSDRDLRAVALHDAALDQGAVYALQGLAPHLRRGAGANMVRRAAAVAEVDRRKAATEWDPVGPRGSLRPWGGKYAGTKWSRQGHPLDGAVKAGDLATVPAGTSVRVGDKTFTRRGGGEWVDHDPANRRLGSRAKTRRTDDIEADAIKSGGQFTNAVGHATRGSGMPPAVLNRAQLGDLKAERQAKFIKEARAGDAREAKRKDAGAASFRAAVAKPVPPREKAPSGARGDFERLGHAYRSRARSMADAMASDAKVDEHEGRVSVLRTQGSYGGPSWQTVEHLPSGKPIVAYHDRKRDAKVHARDLRQVHREIDPHTDAHLDLAHELEHLVSLQDPHSPHKDAAHRDRRQSMADMAGDMARTAQILRVRHFDLDGSAARRRGGDGGYAKHRDGAESALRPMGAEEMGKTAESARHLIGRFRAIAEGSGEPWRDAGTSSWAPGVGPGDVEHARNAWDNGYELKPGAWKKGDERVLSSMHGHTSRHEMPGAVERLKAAGVRPVPHGHFPVHPYHKWEDHRPEDSKLQKAITWDRGAMWRVSALLERARRLTA